MFIHLQNTYNNILQRILETECTATSFLPISQASNTWFFGIPQTVKLVICETYSEGVQ
jgi:hypothetical protein